MLLSTVAIGVPFRSRGNKASAYGMPLVFFFVVPLLFFAFPACTAQDAYGGYTLFCQTNGRTTYLVAMDKTVVHTWQHTLPGVYSTYLLPDGSLLRPAADPNAILRSGAYTGIIERVDWDGNTLWQYRYSAQDRIAHHDIEPMPNGNVLLIAWEVKSASEAAAAGRVNPTSMWVDHLVEVKPTGPTSGEIVWEWHAWDHLVQEKDTAKKNYGIVREHPELLDVNLCQGVMGPWGGDWLHVNAVSYDPIRDLVTVSSHYTSELYVIDHGTTIAEAAGHAGGRYGRGGDLLFRWGNPPNYGAPGPAYFDVVHCSWWIPPGLPGAGNILAFNNNNRGRASAVVELVPPLDSEGRFTPPPPGTAWGPAAPLWTYSAGSTFFTAHYGGNQRLPNGNTLVTESTKGRIFEVTPDGRIAWEYLHGKEIARALRYGYDDPAVSRLRVAHADEAQDHQRAELSVTPNPVTSGAGIHFRSGRDATVRVVVMDMLGREIRTLYEGENSSGEGYVWWDGRDSRGSRAGAGVYFCTLLRDRHPTVVQPIVLNE